MPSSTSTLLTYLEFRPLTPPLFQRAWIEDEPDKEERLGSGYAEPILSLACPPLFS